MQRIQIFKIRPQLDVVGYSQPQPELKLDSVMAAPLLCMLTMCLILHNLHINC